MFLGHHFYRLSSWSVVIIGVSHIRFVMQRARRRFCLRAVTFSSETMEWLTSDWQLGHGWCTGTESAGGKEW